MSCVCCGGALALLSRWSSAGSSALPLSAEPQAWDGHGGRLFLEALGPTPVVWPDCARCGAGGRAFHVSSGGLGVAGQGPPLPGLIPWRGFHACLLRGTESDACVEVNAFSTERSWQRCRGCARFSCQSRWSVEGEWEVCELLDRLFPLCL